MSISSSIISRAYFSILYIQAAARFGRDSAALEKSYTGQYDSELLIKDQCYVLGSILSSVAFLEALINELVSDAREGNRGQLKSLPIEDRKWILNIPETARYSILDKYRMFLALVRRDPFDEKRRPFQDVKHLIELRNALAHFKPEWIEHDRSRTQDQKTLHKFEKSLRSRFSPNPIVGAGNPFYPNKCLGHGCAAWAVTSSLSLADEFCAKIGIKPTYDHVRQFLATS